MQLNLKKKIDALDRIFFSANEWNLNLHIFLSRALDYPEVLSPCASSR